MWILKLLLKAPLMLIGIGLICGSYLFADIYSDSRWYEHMVGEWANAEQPVEPHLFIRQSGAIMMVKQGVSGKEIPARKDDSGHVLMVEKRPYLFYYTLTYLGEGLFSDGPIRFNGDSAVFGKSGATGWEYRKVN